MLGVAVKAYCQGLRLQVQGGDSSRNGGFYLSCPHVMLYSWRFSTKSRILELQT